MATAVDYHRATIVAFKNTLEGKSPHEKDKHVSVQVALQFNSLIERLQEEYPEAAPHFPMPITFLIPNSRHSQTSDIRFIDFELLLNQVLAILDVLRTGK